MNDFDNLEVGELLDIIITFNNENDINNLDRNIRQATQKDFDRF